MKRIGLMLTFLLVGCSTIKYVPVESNTSVNRVDSIAWHDSIIYTYINKERIVDVVSYLDTLNLETEYAVAKAYVDSVSHSLKGELKQKSDTPVITSIKWKEKIEYKDSIITKEIPIPVEVVKKEVPKWCWICLIWVILSIMYIIVKIYLKFYKK